MLRSPSSVLHSPFISIIVPAYNRAEEIHEFLTSFEKQTKNNFEVIVVDDGSTDNTKAIAKNHEQRLNLRYFLQQNNGPGAARNLGMENANGDIFVFIDSDCTVPENYIENLSRHLESKDFDAFGGPDTSHKDFSPFLKAVNYSMTSFIGTGGTRGSKGKQLAKYYPRSFNMGITKEVFKKIGGMNSLRHGQDMEFSNRIYNAGFKIVYFDDLKVYHKRRTNLKKFFKQIFNWGITRINLGRIDTKMLKPIHFLPAIALIGYIISLILAFIIPIFRWIFLGESALLILILLFACMQSTVKNKSLVVGLLSIITLPTQVVAYGTGLITGLIKSLFVKKGQWITGFTKKYYK
ncbi:MAG TPA: glycosyltransferase [Candidatus Cloacimonetes bacterium]|nr:glycosyltransferase [Candidatus Cloacimonadota bacterium]